MRRLAFSSTGSIYGEPEVFPTPETAPFPLQTSLYGASKLAGEGLIEAYCAGFGFQGYIFRFVSILGERYTHGHVFDFYNKLLANPREIEVLGDGKQRKSYLAVQDCIDAILIAIEKAQSPVNIFNLGTDEYCEIDQSLDWICRHLGLAPQRRHTGGQRLDRRQPLHLPGLPQDSRSGLDAADDNPGGRDRDIDLSAGPPVGA